MAGGQVAGREVDGGVIGHEGGPALSAAPLTDGAKSGRQPFKLDAGGYRLALLVLLTLLAVVGLHASIPRPAWGSHTKLHDAEVTGALEGIAIVLFLVLCSAQPAWPREPTLGRPAAYRPHVRPGCGHPGPGYRPGDLLVNIHPPSGTGRAVRSTPVAATAALAAPQSVRSGQREPPHQRRALLLVAAAAAGRIVAISVKALRNRRLEVLPSSSPLPRITATHCTKQSWAVSGLWPSLTTHERRSSPATWPWNRAPGAGGHRTVGGRDCGRAAGQSGRTAPGQRGAASNLTSLFYEARFSSPPGQQPEEAAERALAELATSSTIDVPWARAEL